MLFVLMLQVKRNMWRAVDVRMRALLAAGRHVVLAGDFNVVLPWWGQDNVLRGSGLEKRAASTNRLTASQDARHSRQQLMQQQPQSQDLPGQGSLHVQDGMDTADASGVAVAALALRKQEKQEAAESQQAQELPVALQPPAKEDNFAPHAQFRRGKVSCLLLALQILLCSLRHFHCLPLHADAPALSMTQAGKANIGQQPCKIFVVADHLDACVLLLYFIRSPSFPHPAQASGSSSSLHLQMVPRTPQHSRSTSNPQPVCWLTPQKPSTQVFNCLDTRMPRSQGPSRSDRQTQTGARWV
jgi:hypothetical protein